jgi:eukaryotic-like serine/threonine-protein kinase
MAELWERLRTVLAERYRIERELGRGGMAIVFLAEDLKHQRRVALKVLKPELGYAIGPGRFLREIRIAAQLTHPNILSVHDSGEADGLLFYVMPYVEGESLRARLDREKQLPIEDALTILREVAGALTFAHNSGVIHRDIKPENILLVAGHAVVCDFGIARAIGAAGNDRVTETGLAVGTPAYMSPEQAVGEVTLDGRSDIYSLGCLAFEILGGQPPFTGPSLNAVLARHSLDPVPPLRALRPTIGEGIEKAIERALAKVPRDRFQTAQQFADALGSRTADPSNEGYKIAKPSTVRARAAIFDIRSWPARTMAIAVLGTLLLIGGGAALMRDRNRRADIRWARDEAIPQVERYAEAGDWDAAYALARKAERVTPGDPALAALWPRFSWLLTIPSDPPGARVLRRSYSSGSETWEELGTTPVERIRFPFGFSLVRFELPGRPPLLRALGFTIEGSQELMRLDPVKLDAADSLPPGKVRVSARTPESGAFDSPAELRDFFLGRYEVTNREYKRFVDAGGYQRRDLWEHPFIKDGRVIPWEKAITLFTDRTGRPGPSTWEASDYPANRDDYPVGGVSWYEAAAYARFVGDELPTVHHWRHAFEYGARPWLMPASNLDGDGPAPVGKFQGIGWSGTYDMAGNVREWCFNATGDKRFILGGAWSDESAFDPVESAQPPLDRSAENGFRLAITREDAATAAELRLPVPDQPPRNVDAEEPVTDKALAIYRSMYAYDATPLNPKAEATESTQHWTRQRVSFDAAYAGERVILYLYLPRNAKPPYQTVLYFPGANAFFLSSIDQYRMIHVDFVLKSGRAVAFPVYRGTFERRVKTPISGPNERRERRIKLTNDLRLTVDYLATRKDLDSDRLGYYGYSFGGEFAPVFLTMEPRLRAAVLYMGGLSSERLQPEIEPATFLPRVRVPVLMLSGELDFDYRLETLAKPFFRLLGTPGDRKKHVIAEGGHFVPRSILIREALDWFDRYLGPVR